MAVKLFFCYAHEDEPLLNKLKIHLSPLHRQGLIEMWHDRDISAGTKWEEEIDKHLNEANIILLLVSPDFMNSDYCYGKEMQRALERDQRGEARVIPVIVRPTHWQGVLGKIQALPTDARPITNWDNLDSALYDVTEGIDTLVVTLLAQRSKKQSKDTSNSNSAFIKRSPHSTQKNKQDSHSNPGRFGIMLVVVATGVLLIIGAFFLLTLILNTSAPCTTLGNVDCYWQKNLTIILAAIISALILILFMIVWLIWRRQPTPIGTLSSILLESRRARRSRSGEPETELFTAYLGRHRSLPNKILHRSIITSLELQDYPGISGHIQLPGKNFELIAKKAADKPGKPKEMYIRKTKDESATIDIVRVGNFTTRVAQDHDFLLQDGDIIRINNEDIAKFSR